MPRDAGVSSADERGLPGKRLDSWKEVACYLNRHVTTVRRWERLEALPVHRHRHARLGSIYAYSGELDRWVESRRQGAPDAGNAAAGPPSERLLSNPIVGAMTSRVALCGRDDEMRTLAEAWRIACSGQRQLVMISGEPGTGKTRLSLELARTVTRQGTVLLGRCDREALIPFAPFVTVLQWLLRTSHPRVLRRWLANVEGREELARLVPDVASRVDLGEESPQATADGRRYRMFDACSQWLVAASHDGPLLLIVEDAHWADQGTLLLLRHLVRSTRGAAICILVTYREHEPDGIAGSQEMVDDLRREQSAIPLLLGPLPEQHVRRLIELWTGADPPRWLTDFAREHAGGNPLFVTEVLQHLDETGALARLDHTPQIVGIADVGLPVRVQSLIERRLARLSATTRRTLTVAAVMGREFTMPVLEAIVDVGEGDLLDAMDEALAARIVTEEPGAHGQFSFTHPLIRETLYFGITSARRIRLHHRVAAALERARTPGRLGELAYHFAQAAAYRDAPKAVEYAVRAGEEAERTLALEDAARCYEMALRVVDLPSAGTSRPETRLDLLSRRGRCFFRVGHWLQAKAAFEAALERLGTGQEATRCELLVRLAECAFWLMDLQALRRYAAEGQALAERIGREDLWADAAAWTASAMVADGDVQGGVRADALVIARVGGIRSFALARAPLTLYWAGRAREAAEHATEAVENARRSGDPAFLLYALQHLGLALSGAGRYAEAIRAFDEALAFGRRCGAFPLLARATSMSVAPLLGLGDFEGAAARALEARDLAHRVAFEPPLVSAGIDLLLIFGRSHDPGKADSLLDDTARAVKGAGGWHAWKWNMRLAQARAELALARGDLAEAAQAADDVIEQSRARHRMKYLALALATRARARRSTRRLGAAHDARAAVEVARELGDPAVLLECLLALLESDGNDAALAAARQTAHAMRAQLPEGRLQHVFSAWISSRAPAVLTGGR